MLSFELHCGSMVVLTNFVPGFNLSHYIDNPDKEVRVLVVVTIIIIIITL